MNERLTAIAVASALCGAALAYALPGCTPAKEAAAGGAYGADMDRCVTETDGSLALHKCWDEVNAVWLDAGAEGGK